MKRRATTCMHQAEQLASVVCLVLAGSAVMHGAPVETRDTDATAAATVRHDSLSVNPLGLGRLRPRLRRQLALDTPGPPSPPIHDGQTATRHAFHLPFGNDPKRLQWDPAPLPSRWWEPLRAEDDTPQCPPSAGGGGEGVTDTSTSTNTDASYGNAPVVHVGWMYGRTNNVVLEWVHALAFTVTYRGGLASVQHHQQPRHDKDTATSSGNHAKSASATLATTTRHSGNGLPMTPVLAIDGVIAKYLNVAFDLEAATRRWACISIASPSEPPDANPSQVTTTNTPSQSTNHLQPQRDRVDSSAVDNVTFAAREVYWAPENDVIGQFFRATVLYQTLLRPRPAVREAVQAFETTHKLTVGNYVAIHLRGLEGSCVERAAKNKGSKLWSMLPPWDPVEHTAVDVCNMTTRYLDRVFAALPPNVPVVLAHDHGDPVRAEEIARTYHAVSYTGPHDTIVDMMLLIRAGYLIGNPMSSMSYVAAEVRGVANFPSNFDPGLAFREGPGRTYKLAAQLHHIAKARGSNWQAADPKGAHQGGKT
eukprot:m.46082 g.46082  ORF g.46082 m.46082 type:complete len:535 (-) comp6721_c0_seq2:227-1831(-)